MILLIQNHLIDTEKIFSVSEMKGDYKWSTDYDVNDSGYSYYFCIYAIGVEKPIYITFYDKKSTPSQLEKEKFFDLVNGAREKLIEYWNTSKSPIIRIEI